MVRLRLRRTGTRNKACFRVVATDARSPRDGRFIEVLGYYDPRHEDEKVDLERVDYWLKNGAQPSNTVASLIERARKGVGAIKAPVKAEEPKAEEPKAEEAAPKAEAPATEASDETTATEEAAQKEAAAPAE